MKVNPPPVDPNPARALALLRWDKEVPDKKYFSMLGKLSGEARKKKKYEKLKNKNTLVSGKLSRNKKQ